MDVAYYVNSSNFSSKFLTLTAVAYRIANAHDYVEMLWTGRNVCISSGKRTSLRPGTKGFISEQFLQGPLGQTAARKSRILLKIRISNIK